MDDLGVPPLEPPIWSLVGATNIESSVEYDTGRDITTNRGEYHWRYRQNWILEVGPRTGHTAKQKTIRGCLKNMGLDQKQVRQQQNGLTIQQH